ncbi:TetR/AcrR family transcriptional regulator [Deinococcus humi]|uniref:AcrR family transcriptional regulator n=1 Tax=Deinococcus humi TaxID=662880 RepID=A0A7W8NIQ5_9DEIO|nr:TetR/AcrR family transcriptional regulator [Deinococcus humi]MBB5365297.1 AcrR family transcriptional regulator [Deinococcus humi]GGO35941.1 TetR family transcriptional regulator [Deinococcus humi]
MVNQRRARTGTAKAARRAHILEQARQLLSTARYPALTLTDIAARVGLTKAALFAYFSSKEALFLELYELLLGHWLDTLEKHLQLGGTHTPRSLATLVTSVCEEHPDLLRLIPLLAGLLEHNISVDRAAQHKRWLAERLQTVTPLLEQRLPGLPVGGGLRLLTYTQALIAGLQPMSEPAPAVREAFATHGLDLMHVDLSTALQDSLEALYQGLSAPQAPTDA